MPSNASSEAGAQLDDGYAQGQGRDALSSGGFELDPRVMDVCRRNAESTKARGGEFTVAHDLAVARKGPEIVYARHWGEPATEGDWAKWYCNDEVLGGAKFIHPMPIEREVEACASVVDDEKRSMLRRLEKNKYFLQKAVLALLVRSHDRQ